MPDHSPTILLVDDEDAVRTVLTFPLEKDGTLLSRLATERRRCGGSPSSRSTWSCST